MINNTAYYKVTNMPCGCMKKSDFGREGGKYVVWEMTEKLVVFSTGLDKA